MEPKKIAVLYHIFYEDIIEYIAEQLKCLNRFTPSFLFNISEDLPNYLEVKNYLQLNFPDSIITISSNQGKDIGGKLLLIGLCLQLAIEPDWIILLHDKKSLQALNTKTWKQDLLSIIDCDQMEKINKIISNSANCGVIAAENYISKELKKENHFVGTNGKILEELMKQYELKCRNFEFIAGTMFWAKANILLDFFKRHDPFKIRQTLEFGNVLDNFSGSHTHSWERILTWIITSKGLTIKTVK